MGKAKRTAAEPLLEVDRAARKLFEPYRKSAPVRALDWFGQAGDQLQLRVLCGAVIALGLLRGDARLASAGARMLASHEAATLAKKAVKNRVDRVRPRSVRRGTGVRPRPGSSRAKALNSFPSGHSAGATAVARAFAAEYPEYRAAALAAGGAVSLAQVPTASHYPSDVAAGATIGVGADAAVGLCRCLAVRAWRRWSG